MAFLVIVLALSFLFEYKVDASAASVSSALPASMVDKVQVSSFEGAIQIEMGAGEGMGNRLTPTLTEAWNATNGVIIMPQGVTTTGCSSVSSYTVGVSFNVSNELPEPMDVAATVSVFDNKTGRLLDAQSLQLSLTPGKTVPVQASFTIASGDTTPVFLAKVTFPTAEDASNVPAASRQVPLFEFLLMRAGLLRS